MPLAGTNPSDRAMAHVRTAQRYAEQAEPEYTRKAVAHFGRALDYAGLRQQHFGANSDDEEVEVEVEAYIENPKNKWTWVNATADQKAAFNNAIDQIAHAGQVVEGMPMLTPPEPTLGAVYNDRKEPSILWYVGKTYPQTRHMTPLRRKTPKPTSPWVLLTPADHERPIGHATGSETENKKRKR